MSDSVVAGVILAGGRSSRMGGDDKCLRWIGGEPLLSHVVRRLAPQVSRLALNANGDPSRFAGFGLSVVSDTVQGFPGPLAGILAGLEWAADYPDVTHLVTVAGDTPFFPTDLAARLLARAHEEQVVMAASGGRFHPVFALWPLALRDDLAGHLATGGSLKVKDYAARYGIIAVDFGMQDLGGLRVVPFFNVNTPDDLDIAENLVARAPS